ncbi:flagellar autonomy 2 NIMA family kinase [Haematococcus lacustris]
MAGPGAQRMRMEDFDIQGEISKGSFGIVYKLVRKSDGRVFALKQVKLAGMKRVDRQEAIDEARVLAQLSHPNVTRHYESFIDKDDKLNIIMEYASKGNVAAMIKAQRGKGLQEDLVWRILIQATMGLSHIHSKKIIHRDIKALNLFIDANNNIKIGDLGIARSLNEGSEFAHSILGTPYYLAPELCEDKPYNTKSDMWALGVVLYECCTGHYPFEAQNQGALLRKILKGQYAPISGPYTGNLVQLVSALLTFRPEQRPDTAAILRNPTVVAKAQALGIDLNPRPTALVEDRPVYQQQQQSEEQMAGPGLPLPSHQQGAHHYQQQQQYYPGSQVQQPAAVRPSSARAAPGPHPFDLPAANGQQPVGLGYAGQGRDQQRRAQVPAQQPQQQYQPYPQQQQQQQQQYPPYQPYPQQQQQAQDPYDQMADDIERMQLGTAEFNRVNMERQRQQLQANVHNGRKDNMKGLLGQPQAPTPVNNRLQPEALPAAGARAGGAHGGSPFALHHATPDVQTQSRMQSSQVWGAKYSPPTHGRRRCPELQITGPSLRGQGGGRPGSARAAGGGGGYVAAADDATTYVSSSYATYLR